MQASLLTFLVWCIAFCFAHNAVAQEPRTLAIDQYRVSFAENFDSLDVSSWGEPPARWIAHTPWSGDFGDARFADPKEGFPFTIADGILRIEARKGPDGKWRSGLLSAVNKNGNGFSQQYGYFEARMKLPPGPGVWPAFWLAGVDRSHFTPEIDAIEYYGHAPDEFRSVYHVWREQKGGENSGDQFVKKVEPGALTIGFNTYGIEINPKKTGFYFNRELIWEIDTPKEFQGRFFPLVNLALGSGWPIDHTPSPSYLYVDYIRVYQKIGG